MPPKKPLTLEDIRDRATITIPEAAQLLGVSKGVAYGSARQGQIPVLELGARRVVPVAAFLRMLGEEPGPAVIGPEPRSREGPETSEADPGGDRSAGLETRFGS